MSAFLISFVRKVHDRKKLEAYWAKSGPTFEGTGFKSMSVYAPFEVLEGAKPLEGIVLIEFPNMEAAKTWYFGERYQAVRPLREGAADIDIVLVDGRVITSPSERMPDIP